MIFVFVLTNWGMFFIVCCHATLFMHPNNHTVNNTFLCNYSAKAIIIVIYRKLNKTTWGTWQADTDPDSRNH